MAARRGGDSGGDSGGYSGGGNGGSSGDSGGSYGGGSSGGGGSFLTPEETLPDGLDGSPSACGYGQCGCSQLFERQMVYGLPGIYYNGTVTIRHEVTNSSVWNNVGSNICGMDDKSVKTYSYPALFLAAPRGNASDTNPFHWRLFGFQPADQTNGTHAPYLDIFQRWVHIRSSDFVLSNTAYGGGWRYRGYQSRYWESDSTDNQWFTNVYWPTNITKWGDGEFSARAEYTRNSSKGSFSSYPEGVTSSNYVTLSNVCAHNQAIYGSENPKSKIPKGNDYANTTTPTVWLQLGAKAEINNVGAESMSFTLNNTLGRAVPYISGRQAQCTNDEAGSYLPFELSRFSPLEPNNDYQETQMAVKISLEFKGDIVSENSTKITGREDGDVVFQDGYVTPTPSSSSGQSNGSQSDAGGLDFRWAMISAFSVGLFTVTFLVSSVW